MPYLYRDSSDYPHVEDGNSGNSDYQDYAGGHNFNDQRHRTPDSESSPEYSENEMEDYFPDSNASLCDSWDDIPQHILHEYGMTKTELITAVRAQHERNIRQPIRHQSMHVLELARREGIWDHHAQRLLESEVDGVWRRILRNPDGYIMAPQEFAIFNFFQGRFQGNELARQAHERYMWHNMKIPEMFLRHGHGEACQAN